MKRRTVSIRPRWKRTASNFRRVTEFHVWDRNHQLSSKTKKTENSSQCTRRLQTKASKTTDLKKSTAIDSTSTDSRKTMTSSRANKSSHPKNKRVSKIWPKSRILSSFNKPNKAREIRVNHVSLSLRSMCFLWPDRCRRKLKRSGSLRRESSSWRWTCRTWSRRTARSRKSATSCTSRTRNCWKGSIEWLFPSTPPQRAPSNRPKKDTKPSRHRKASSRSANSPYKSR